MTRMRTKKKMEKIGRERFPNGEAYHHNFITAPKQQHRKKSFHISLSYICVYKKQAASDERA